MMFVLAVLLSFGIASVSVAQEGTGGQPAGGEVQGAKVTKKHKKKHGKRHRKGKKKEDQPEEMK